MLSGYAIDFRSKIATLVGGEKAAQRTLFSNGVSQPMRLKLTPLQTFTISEVVHALAAQVSASNIEHYQQPVAQMHLKRSFGLLKNSYLAKPFESLEELEEIAYLRKTLTGDPGTSAV